MNESTASTHPVPVGITIGAMSQATGIPANTLRTWERRYGFPGPERTDSGQRLYSPALIGHLRLIHQALESGHRPRQVLSLPEEDLRRLLERANTGLAERPVSRDTSGKTWFDAVQGLDGNALTTRLRAETARLGVLRFLTERAGPMMVEMGEAWRNGRLQIYQEHWASEHLRSFLIETWQPLSATATGPTLVASTLPHDRHDLGLHMAVTVMAMCGWRIVFLGRDTPIEDIASATERADAPVTLISVSQWSASDLALAHLQSLRSRLHPSTRLLVGGAGAPQEVEGVTYLGGLEALYAWASQPFPT
jgi:methanogenic corrinoid protein MtbC1